MTSGHFSVESFDTVELRCSFPQPERWVELNVIGAAAAIPSLAALSAAERDAFTRALEEDLQPIVAGFVEHWPGGCSRRNRARGRPPTIESQLNRIQNFSSKVVPVGTLSATRADPTKWSLNGRNRDATTCAQMAESRLESGAGLS